MDVTDGQWRADLWGDHLYNSHSADQFEEGRFGPLTVGLLGTAALLSNAFTAPRTAVTCISHPTTMGCPANCATDTVGCNIIPRNCVLMPSAIGCPLVCRTDPADVSCAVEVENCVTDPTNADCPPICAADPTDVACMIPIPMAGAANTTAP